MKIVLTREYENMHGRSGDLIIYNWKGIKCARCRVIPSNPRTKNQQANRMRFAEASASWRALPDETKRLYNFRASGLGRSISGFNLYMSDCMNARIRTGAQVQEAHGKRNIRLSNRHSGYPLRINTVQGQGMLLNGKNTGLDLPPGYQKLARAS
ncbi:MAG TPA: hypothetical protein PK514_11330 [Spirochaetota bacterium]|nr:hypothetical protein [Spirochaetota bacterium]